MTQSPFFTLAFWFLLLPALWVSGSIAGFRLRLSNPLFSGVLKLGLGLGVYAYVLTLAGSLGVLKPGAVLCFLTLPLMFGWRTGMGVFHWLKDMSRFLWEPGGLFCRICQFSLFLAIVFTGLICFLPEISNDALSIQLYFAKIFAKNASIAPLSYHIDSYRPLLMSVLYSTGLLFQNVAIAKFFHWFCGVLLILALADRVDKVSSNRKLAIFFGLMFWLTPTLMNQITTTYLDAGASLFIFLGCCLVLEGLEELDPAHFVYGGLLVGLAVAIRSLSLCAFFAIMIVLGLQLFRHGVKRRVAIAGGCFALGVFMTAAYWFLRDWIYTGNPVFPFMGKWFGTQDFSLFSTIYFHGMGLPRSLTSFLMIPWDITVKPQYFDYHHWIGPFYLSVLPFVVYAAVRIRRARSYLLFVLFLTTFWYFTGQNVRYLLPALPVYLLAAAMGLKDFSETFLRKGWQRLAARTVAVVSIAALLSLTAYHFRYQFMPLVRRWSTAEYLEKMERTIPMAKWINKNLSRDARILLWEEVHLFYFDRDMFLEGYSFIPTRYPEGVSVAGGSAILKGRGITHLLVSSKISPSGVHFQPSRVPFLNLILLDRRFTKEISAFRSVNVSGAQYQYVLYELI